MQHAKGMLQGRSDQNITAFLQGAFYCGFNGFGFVSRSMIAEGEDVDLDGPLMVLRYIAFFQVSALQDMTEDTFFWHYTVSGLFLDIPVHSSSCLENDVFCKEPRFSSCS